MKKITLLTATALTLAGLGSQTLTAQAAAKNWEQICSNGNRVYVTYGTGCDIQGLLDNLQNCFPNITLPDCDTPDINIPEIETPDINIPEVEAPDTNIPDAEMPDINIPDVEVPDVNTPETETPDTNAPETEAPEDTTSHAFIKQVVELVNAERAKEGLSPLTINTNVQAAAWVRAVECEQSFSHTRPNGSSFATALKEQNVSYRSAGENIAWGQRSPEEVMHAWMNSEGHRDNIMNPNFTTIGVGYYQNANGVNYWCQLFTN